MSPPLSAFALVSKGQLAAIAGGALVVACVAACGTRFPGPPVAANNTAAYVVVPYPPPPARIEYIPERPSDTALWVDGEWRYRGRRWRWSPGAWFDVPKGVRFAHWASTIRSDGAFVYAPGAWMAADGKSMPSPRIVARGVSNVLNIDEDPGVKDEPEVHGPDVPPNLKAGIGSGSGVAPASSANSGSSTPSSGAH